MVFASIHARVLAIAQNVRRAIEIERFDALAVCFDGVGMLVWDRFGCRRVRARVNIIALGLKLADEFRIFDRLLVGKLADRDDVTLWDDHAVLDDAALIPDRVWKDIAHVPKMRMFGDNLWQ